MYADSEMSFFGRENLRNSAFQRGKTFFLFIHSKGTPLLPVCQGEQIAHAHVFGTLRPPTLCQMMRAGSFILNAKSKSLEFRSM